MRTCHWCLKMDDKILYAYCKQIFSFFSRATSLVVASTCNYFLSFLSLTYNPENGCWDMGYGNVSVFFLVCAGYG